MSRRRFRRRQRDNNNIANVSLLRRFEVPDLRLFEDRRSSFPSLYRPARGVFSWSSDIVPAAPRSVTRRSDMSLPFRLSFRVPRDVFICVRRKQRKEVLFAMRRTGKGARSPFRRRNEFSDVRC